MKNKIAVVVAYFGKFPNYFPLWLKSCGYNPTIDFIIVSDQTPDNLPKNVIAIPMSLDDVRERATKVLGFPAALHRPYKCCDYKPLYGLIFSDLLFGYDYWGHCDVDLIFGDLQHFFDKHHLYNYDKFGVLGHLSLFRNVEKVNNAYRLEGSYLDYRQVYSSDNGFAFDEVGGIAAIMMKNGFSVFTDQIMADISMIFRRYRIVDTYEYGNGHNNYNIQTFCWERGKVNQLYWENGSIQSKELYYIHFKKRPNYMPNFDTNTTDAFYITNTGFYPKGNDISKDIILKMNPFRGSLYEYIEKKKFDISSIINRIKRRILSK